MPLRSEDYIRDKIVEYAKKNKEKYSHVLHLTNVESFYEGIILRILKKISKVLSDELGKNLNSIIKIARSEGIEKVKDSKDAFKTDEKKKRGRFFKVRDALSKVNIDIKKLSYKVIESDLYDVSVSTNFSRVFKEIYRSSSHLLERDFHKVMPTASIHFEDKDLHERLKNFVGKNVSLIKNLSDWKRKKVHSVVKRGVFNGHSYQEIAAELKELNLGMYKRRAKIIARDQVSKAYTSLNQYRHKELGVKRFIWYTSLDERVRPTHIAVHGKVYSYKSGAKVGGVKGVFPGQEILCRCVAMPVLKSVKKKEEKKKKKKKVEKKKVKKLSTAKAVAFSVGGIGLFYIVTRFIFLNRFLKSKAATKKVLSKVYERPIPARKVYKKAIPLRKVYEKPVPVRVRKVYKKTKTIKIPAEKIKKLREAIIKQKREKLKKIKSVKGQKSKKLAEYKIVAERIKRFRAVKIKKLKKDESDLESSIFYSSLIETYNYIADDMISKLSKSIPRIFDIVSKIRYELFESLIKNDQDDFKNVVNKFLRLNEIKNSKIERDLLIKFIGFIPYLS